MRSKIDQELLRLGAPTGRLGYVQMAMTLELIMQEEQVTSTTRVLYPKVAEKCGTKPARIERNVREEIKAIWNFAHVDLKVPKEVQVENVHLSDSLMKLSYMLERYEKESRKTNE